MALDFTRVKATIADLAAELKKFRGERETLLRKREDLEGAPICQSDLLELIDAWIDRKAQDFPQRLQGGINFYVRHPLAVLPENQKAVAHPMAVLTACPSPNDLATLNTLEASLFYVLGDSIKKGLRQAVETFDFSAAGPPRAERLATIKAIDARIDAIDKLEQSLTDEAEKAGLKI